MEGTMAGAKKRLMSEFTALQKEKWCNIELVNDSLFRWHIGLIVVNSDSVYNGGYFTVEMTFSNRYNIEPPTFRFLHKIWHPNIYPDGKLCISILHPPGDDIMSGETAQERWTPLHGVESVLRSVLLLLDDPECSSPANVDAGVMYRNDRKAFNIRAAADVQKSREDIPQGFVMPITLEEERPKVVENDDDFWAMSCSDNDEDDFGGSDSSGEGEGEDMEFGDDDEDQEFEDDEDEHKA